MIEIQKTETHINIDFAFKDIKNLDDMASLFFLIASKIDHPLKELDLTLVQTFEEKNKT